jgi:hypothetical protein
MLPPLPAPPLEASLFALFAAGSSNLPYYIHAPILLVIISIVYSATRFDDWPLIFREAFRWGSRLLVFLLVIVVVLYVYTAIGD